MRRDTRKQPASLGDKTDRQGSALPRAWQDLVDRYPQVAAAYDVLSDVCRHSGPLDQSTIALVKLAVSVGVRSHRTVHAHAKKALGAGVDPEALRQVALIAFPTVGLPAALDVLRWIDESIREAEDDAAMKTGTRQRPAVAMPANPRTNDNAAG